MVRMKDEQQSNIGLPELQQVFEKKTEVYNCWDDLTFIDMDFSTVMYPHVEGDKLKKSL